MTHAISDWLDQREPPEDSWAGEPEPVAALPLPAVDLSCLDAPLPQPDWLVPDWMLRRSLTLLGSKPGVGKSWLSQDLAVALGTGRPWLGQEPADLARVLYVDAENGTDLVLERLQQLGARSDRLGGRLHYTTAGVTLPASDGVARLAATIEQHRPDLVIVDTLASVAPSAEKDTEASSAFLAAVWFLTRDHGAAMLLLHHLRKGLQGAPRDDSLDAFRGAGHLVGAASRAWILDPLIQGEPKFVLRDVKARRGRRNDDLRIHVVDSEDRDPHTGAVRTTVEVVGRVAAVENGYDTYIARVLEYLANRPTGTARTNELIHLRLDIAERTAKDYLARAHATGVLDKPAYGTWARQTTTPIADDTEGAA